MEIGQGRTSAGTFGRNLLALLLSLTALTSCSDLLLPVEPPMLMVRTGPVGTDEPISLDGATVTGEVTVQTDGSSAFDIIRYYLDSEPLGGVALASRDAEPFELYVDTRALADGAHHIVAVAEVDGVVTGEGRADFTVVNPDPVVNQAPVVDAGPDTTATTGAALELFGSVADDGLPTDGVGVEWSLVSGPTQPTFAPPDAALTTVVFPMTGTYVLRLSATDGVAHASDELAVEVASAVEPGGPNPDYDGLAQIYVAPGGSDDGSGTIDEPLATVGAALRRALNNRKDGEGTRVLLMPGTYREELVGGYDSRPGPLIVLESYRRHEAVITGADEFEEWTCQGAQCTHPWSYDWGPTDHPWPGDVEIGELALRREMVIVNGRNLEQVLSAADLDSGSFFVDEGANLLRVVPPAGVDLKTAEVEVAVRPVLLRTQGLSNFVVDGIVFRHAASEFRQTAVDIVDQSDVVLRNSRIEWNGQNGLSMKGHHITVEQVDVTNNGSSGLVGYRVADVLVEGVSVSFNNWRGVRGNYTTWEVGNKFVHGHRVTLRDVSISSNRSRGLWFDTDNVDVVLENVRSCDNLRDGLFVEANQGPIAIEGGTFCRNGSAGILTSSSHRISVRGATLEGNEQSQFFLSGSFGNAVTDWETGERHVLDNRDWQWQGNVVRSAGGGPLIATTHPVSQWSELMASSYFDGNSYASSEAKTFQVGGGSFVDLPEWKSRSGQDASSSFVLE